MHWVLHCGGYKENWGLVWKHTVGQGELNLAKSHLRHSLSKGFGVKTTHGKLRVWRALAGLLQNTLNLNSCLCICGRSRTGALEVTGKLNYTMRPESKGLCITLLTIIRLLHDRLENTKRDTVYETNLLSSLPFWLQAHCFHWVSLSIMMSYLHFQFYLQLPVYSYIVCHPSGLTWKPTYIAQRHSSLWMCCIWLGKKQGPWQGFYQELIFQHRYPLRSLWRCPWWSGTEELPDRVS